MLKIQSSMSAQNQEQKQPQRSSRSASHSSLHIEKTLQQKPNANSCAGGGSSTSTTSPPLTTTTTIKPITSSTTSKSTTTSTTVTTNQQRVVKLKKHASFASSAIIINPDSCKEIAENRNNKLKPRSQHGSISTSPPPILTLPAPSSKQPSTSSILIHSQVVPTPGTAATTIRPHQQQLIKGGTNRSSSSFSGLRPAISKNHTNQSLPVTSEPSASSPDGPIETVPFGHVAKPSLQRRLGPAIGLGLGRRRALTMDNNEFKCSNNSTSGIKQHQHCSTTNIDSDSNDSSSDDLSSSEESHNEYDSTSTASTTTTSTTNSVSEKQQKSDQYSANPEYHFSLQSQSAQLDPKNAHRNSSGSSGYYTRTKLDDDGLEVTDIDLVRLDQEDYQYLMQCMKDDDDDDDDGDGDDSNHDQRDINCSDDGEVFNNEIELNKINGRLMNSLRVTDQNICPENPISAINIDEQQQQPTNNSWVESQGSSLSKPSITDESIKQQTMIVINKQTNSGHNRRRTKRADYAWYPPNLTLEQIREFFRQFPLDKIPYKRSNGAIYRDRQIAYQLPKQDISSDYCNYLDDHDSLKAYREFVNIRNIGSLDVAHIIQVQQANLTGLHKMADHLGSAIGQQGPAGPIDYRKSSIISQTSLIDNAKSQVATNIIANFKCRRCLVRIEDGQLAVVAPKFVIGITSSVPTSSPSSIAQQQHQQQQQQMTATNSLTGATTSNTNTQSTNSKNYSQVGLFHPKCFTCSTCKEFLVDLVYCIKDNKLYCLRHYGDSIRPRCGACEEEGSLKSVKIISNLCLCKCFQKRRKDYHSSGSQIAEVSPIGDQPIQQYPLRKTTATNKNDHLIGSDQVTRNPIKQLIFSDEYSKAMSEDFHVDHFLCRHCNSNLAGHRYVLKEEQPFCIGCYESQFANTCEDCHKPIGLDSRDLSYKDKHWHDSCFICHKCSQSLIDRPFGSKSDHIYCADCYDSNFATRCDRCDNPFRAGSKKMEYRGRQWHDSCFCCCVCKNTIGSSSFIPKNEEIYCIKCYEDKYATRCTKCKQVIVSGGVTFRNEPWHPDCFTCCNCNKSLAGQRFTTRDEKNQEQEPGTNKSKQLHNAYCIDCYGELFAKRCFACSQAITGIGGTKFVTFEDRNWHNDCFICTDCQTSLVGKGFITDGPDAILCGDCARAKLRS